jgi:hypothetical protein
MTEENLFILEVRGGVILYLNERTPFADGWYWGTDDYFRRGPFASASEALADARRGNNLKILYLNSEFLLADEEGREFRDDLPDAGHIIVVNTKGAFWRRPGENEPRGGFDELVADGKAIKTKRMRRGRPVYVLREFATPEEIEEAERERLSKQLNAEFPTAPPGGRRQ